jgi:hypothetical protein
VDGLPLDVEPPPVIVDLLSIPDRVKLRSRSLRTISTVSEPA